MQVNFIVRSRYMSSTFPIMGCFFNAICLTYHTIKYLFELEGMTNQIIQENM